MPFVNPTLPADGETADAEDISVPFSTLLAIFNGHIGEDNMEPGTFSWGMFDPTLSNAIPAAAMKDEGNLVKYRDETNIGFVASGLVWSTVSGLNGTMSSGVLYVPDGTRVAVSSVSSRAFTASKDTYVDIGPTGTLAYNEATNGATSPTLASNYIRLAKVVTNGSAITGVTVSGVDSIGQIIKPTAPTGPAQRYGGFAVGTVTLTATGSKAVTGLGFKPKYVEFTFLQTASATRSVISNGWADGVNQSAINSVATDTPNSYSVNSTSRCLYVANTSGTTLIDATFTSMDADGFTVNVLNFTNTYGSIFTYRAFG